MQSIIKEILKLLSVCGLIKDRYGEGTVCVSAVQALKMGFKSSVFLPTKKKMVRNAYVCGLQIAVSTLSLPMEA